MLLVLINLYFPGLKMLKNGMNEWERLKPFAPLSSLEFRIFPLHNSTQSFRKMPHYTSRITSKLPLTGTTIFTTMSALAAEHKAINLSQGFPGFDPDPKLIKKASKAMKQGHNQYAPMAGLLALREEVSKVFERRDGLHYHPEKEITITAGATQALFTAIQALVRENDEVIVFTPAYDCYVPALELVQAKVHQVALRAPDYRIDWEQVKQLFSRRTKMIIINTPHNPTGTMMSETDIRALEEITRGTDCIVLSDEVYEHIVFDGEKHWGAASKPGLAERSLIVGSFGKTFHVTGWKTGYVCGPEELMTEFRKVHQYNVFCCNTPIQLALAEHMKNEQPEKTLGAFYQKKRDLFNRALEGSAFEITPSTGTYFQLLNYRKLSREKDTEIATQWTVDFGIASIPISVFYQYPVQDHVLRFCFAKEDDELLKAAKRLHKISKTLLK